MRTQSNLGVFSVSFKLFLVFVFLLFLISAKKNQADAAVIPPDEPACIFKQNSRNAIGVRDATPNQNVAIFTGFRQGTTTIQNGNCAGTEIGIKSAKSIAKLRMNGEGNKNGKIFIPSTSENRGFMQILDFNTCNTGNVRDVIYTDARPGNKRCMYHVINNQPPVSVIETSITFARAPVEIFFDGSDSFDPEDNLPLTYVWTFSNDNSQQSGEFASKTFNTPGMVMVTLKVTDSLGAMSETTVQLNILPPGDNDLPIANFSTLPDRCAFYHNELIDFDASSSSDTDGEIQNYMWDFGNGNTQSRTVSTTKFLYSTGDMATISLTVKDNNNGVSDPVTKKIFLGPPGDLIVGVIPDPDPPVCVAPCEIDFTGAIASPDTLTSIQWDFSDDGSMVNNQEMISHTFATEGIHNVTLTVQDDMGRNKTASQMVNILGSDPVAFFTWSPVVGTRIIDFDASLSGSPNGPIVEYSWDFMDNDSITSTADPEISNHYPYSSTWDVELKITDSLGMTDIIVQPVTVQPTPNPSP